MGVSGEGKREGEGKKRDGDEIMGYGIFGCVACVGRRDEGFLQ